MGRFAVSRRGSYLSGFLTQGMAANWLLTRGTDNADEELFAATIVVEETSTGLRGVSSLYAAPVWRGGCNTAYEDDGRHRRRRARRRATRSSRPSPLPSISGARSRTPSRTRQERRASSFMPAGSGACVAVKSEIFY